MYSCGTCSAAPRIEPESQSVRLAPLRENPHRYIPPFCPRLRCSYPVLYCALYHVSYVCFAIQPTAAKADTWLKVVIAFDDQVSIPIQIGLERITYAVFVSCISLSFEDSAKKAYLATITRLVHAEAEPKILVLYA